MNLTFGICWIEDQASVAEIAAIESAVRNNGFEPDITKVEAEEKISKFAQEQEHFQNFALILLDLNLGSNLKGDEIAPDIRLRFRSTPILFYSTEAEDALRVRIANRRVEGVYCSHRERLADRVAELVSDLSPALNRLSGMRGLAAGVVAECDQEFRKILRFWSRGAISEAELVAALKKRAGTSLNHGVESLDKATTLEEVLSKHAVSSAVLFREVTSLVRSLGGSDAIKAKRRSLRNYEKEVLEGRNVLSHVLEERGPDGWRIRPGGQKADVTVEDFQTYRSRFLARLRDVRELRELLVGDETNDVE